MLKKGISILALASFISFTLCSCAGDRTTQPGARRGDAGGAGAEDPSWLENQLSEAPELRELVDIRSSIVWRAVENHVTAQQLREAAYDSRRANELLGYSDFESRCISERIDYLIGSLRQRYPALGGLIARQSSTPVCTACDVDRFATSWDGFCAAMASAPANSLVPAREPMKCKWVQLTIGFGLCAAKSGGSLLVYVICSYAIFCGSCDGGVADVLCFR